MSDLESIRDNLLRQAEALQEQIDTSPDIIRLTWYENTGLSADYVDPLSLGITKIVEPKNYWDMNDAFEWWGLNFHLSDGRVLRVRLCGHYDVFGFDECVDIGDEVHDTDGMSAVEAWEFLSAKIPDTHRRVAAMVYRVYNGLEGA